MAYCFAWDQNAMGKWGCKATTLDCDGTDERCPFFRTMQEHLDARERAKARIAGLPDWQQTAISEKHYGGERPWRVVEPVGAGDISQGMVKE